MKRNKHELDVFYLLWSTQSLSQLGSALTSFALTLWLYEKTGLALSAATLTVCAYAPYVTMSVFAGTLADRLDKRRTMLVCDILAAAGTLLVFVLYKTDMLAAWHLYAISAVNGLMNSVQQPASEVAYTLIVPKGHYQRTSGLQSLSRSLVSVGSPLIATTLYGLAGLGAAIAVDLATFAVAFAALALFIKLPSSPETVGADYSVREAMGEGLAFLRENHLVRDVILFLSGVNLLASAFDATLPAYVIPNPRGGNDMLGVVTACSGAAMLAGSLIATVLPKPKNRVRVIYLSMLISLGIENFVLVFSRNPALWCVAQVVGWVLVPVMSANYDVVVRSTVPVELQGRVYACRNTLQYFTIPIGLLLGGFLVDELFEPHMALCAEGGLMGVLFGAGKGSGAALMMFVLGVAGVVYCMGFGARLRKYQFVE